MTPRSVHAAIHLPVVAAGAAAVMTVWGLLREQHWLAAGWAALLLLQPGTQARRMQDVAATQTLEPWHDPHQSRRATPRRRAAAAAAAVEQELSTDDAELLRVGDGAARAVGDRGQPISRQAHVTPQSDDATVHGLGAVEPLPHEVQGGRVQRPHRHQQRGV
jgi:hypothetical protein